MHTVVGGKKLYSILFVLDDAESNTGGDINDVKCSARLYGLKKTLIIAHHGSIMICTFTGNNWVCYFLHQQDQMDRLEDLCEDIRDE